MATGSPSLPKASLSSTSSEYSILFPESRPFARSNYTLALFARDTPERAALCRRVFAHAWFDMFVSPALDEEASSKSMHDAFKPKWTSTAFTQGFLLGLL